MPRVYTWSRALSEQAVTTGGRFALRLGDFPAGSTLERVIFSYNIRQQIFYGGTTSGPEDTRLRLGVIAQPISAGTPDIDPGNPVDADWLWAGLVYADVVQLRRASVEEYHFRFVSPNDQLETVTRRHNGLSESERVWMVTSPIGERNSSFLTWNATAYGSVLYSELSP